MGTIDMGDGTFLVSTDSRGRINLGKVAKKSKSYAITEEPGGRLILTPTKVVTDFTPDTKRVRQERHT